MSFAWVLLSFIGIVIVFAFAHVATRMASERESIGRPPRVRKRMRAETANYASHGPESADGN